MALPPLPLGPFTHLHDAERQRSLRDTMLEAPDVENVWVFAYGSLMWNSCFDVAESHHAVLHGYSRAFSIFTVEARGTPARPGLGLALQPGGTCQGIALRIADDGRDAGLARLWAREMLTGIYSPAWVSVAAPGSDIAALTFVVNAGQRGTVRDGTTVFANVATPFVVQFAPPRHASSNPLQHAQLRHRSRHAAGQAYSRTARGQRRGDQRSWRRHHRIPLVARGGVIGPSIPPVSGTLV